MRQNNLFVGENPKVKAILRQAEQLAYVPRAVIICGERGTGKELIARHLHYSGNRKDKPFIVLNCGALGGDLLRSELFGHEKGAFTGATQGYVGKLEQADAGTLFLDEIGNMSLEFQEKILRVVEYQEFERVGGKNSIKVDVRIIAATNADLTYMIKQNTFRADLYDRLSFAVLQIPPLRERRSDIPLLITHFARQLAEEIPAMEWRSFSKAALEDLSNYYWPGNIRQLKNVVEQIYILGNNEFAEIQPSELSSEITAVELHGGTFEQQLEVFQRSLIINTLRENNNRRIQLPSAPLGRKKMRW